MVSLIFFTFLKNQAQQTTTDLYQNIFKNYSKILENELKTSIQQRDYVLKFKGMEEYLVDPSLKLIYYPTIRNLLRKNQKIEVVLLEKKSLPIKNWEKLTDYYQEVKNFRGFSGVIFVV